MADEPAAGPGISVPLLAIAVTLMLSTALRPDLLVGAAGRADHVAAAATGWAMAAGFVRGVGFVPRRALWRALFGAAACLAALAIAIARLMADRLIA